ncbi:thymidylate kinase [Streptomyces sp. NA02950]|uniref:dTMP kinase n=1 Tax=Streptomyces sp. NA02950 TaxID=2742137 RepID=UPI0020CB2493|nr:thymidylate kinase [Streptomyces sp. NA02950]
MPSAYLPIELKGSPGPFVVFEGVSGIGKTTLASTVTRRMEATSLHTLPLPHSDWSSAVNSRLRSLPQFAFYLSGLLHASDMIRHARMIGPVIADRYVSSVIACHGAVHGVAVQQVVKLLEAFRSYLVQPTCTFYLRCSESALRERMSGKRDVKQDDTDLFAIPDRLSRLLANFEAVAASDPTAVLLDTDDRTPDELADQVIARMEADSA